MTDDDLRSEEQSVSLRPLLPWLLLASAISVTMMVLGAGRGDRILPALSAGLFAALIVGTGLGINAPLWAKAKGGGYTLARLKSALRCNVWLAAVVYAWGASALFAMYSLAELNWRHPFQYATGACIFAAGLAIYGTRLGRKKNSGLPPLALTLLHGGAAAGGLAFLVATGKLSTIKDDWAANEVFLWGGVAIVAICVMSILTQIRPTRP